MLRPQKSQWHKFFYPSLYSDMKCTGMWYTKWVSVDMKMKSQTLRVFCVTFHNRNHHLLNIYYVPGIVQVLYTYAYM